ncbi:4-hydroxy-2-oxovalerate aldolase [Clostridioides difficile]|nr:4-hydroxy-2-oxovalerate aldolase [Clostridioides difficile]
MKLLDCTLRDGANVVGNGFSKELTISIIQALLDCGINQIELGNAKGIGAYENGANAPLTDLEYMQSVAQFSKKGCLGMFLQVYYASPERVQMAAENGLQFLRVGAAAGDGEKSIPAIKMVKEAGLYCRYSLMKAYICTPDALAKEAKMLQEAGVDNITIMDSAGTMFPEDTTAYVKAMKEQVSIPIGFHGHSNLGMAQANALAAIEAGAEEIDCGLLGMARSAGNCATELAVAAFQRKNKLKTVDFYKLLEYLEQDLIPAMAVYNYQPAVKPLDFILGLSGCHSSFIKMFEEIAKEEKVSLYQLIVKVSEKDKKKPSEELIRKTAETLRCIKS